MILWYAHNFILRGAQCVPIGMPTVCWKRHFLQLIWHSIGIYTTASRHTNGYKQCCSSRRLVPLFVWGRLDTRASQDDVLSLNNSMFCDFVYRIYPIELEIKDTTNTNRFASYLDLHHEIDSGRWWRNKLYDKRNDFKFPIVNFQFICSNIPAAPAYGVYISQLIQYSRGCCSYQYFLDRGFLLTRKLLIQGFL